MATQQVTGTNYSLTDGVVCFFYARGAKAPEGYWTINAMSDDQMFEAIPNSIMGQVLTCIEGARKAGKADQITYVQVGPRSAVTAFLEGMITADHLVQATESEDYVEIPGVQVGGLTLLIRVLRGHEPHVAIADSQGIII